MTLSSIEELETRKMEYVGRGYIKGSVLQNQHVSLHGGWEYSH